MQSQDIKEFLSVLGRCATALETIAQEIVAERLQHEIYVAPPPAPTPPEAPPVKTETEGN